MVELTKFPGISDIFLDLYHWRPKESESRPKISKSIFIESSKLQLQVITEFHLE